MARESVFRSNRTSFDRSAGKLRVSHQDVRRFLTGIRGLKKEERLYLRGKFREATPTQWSHLSKDTYDKVLRQMAKDPKDPIGGGKIRKLRELKEDLFK